MGIRFYRAWHVYFQGPELISPLLADLEERNVKFKFGQSARPPAIVLDTSEGYRYSIEPTGASVRFDYVPDRFQPPGELEQQRVQEMRPFTQLLDDAIERMDVLAGHLSAGSKSSLAIDRLGILASCRFAKGKEPPGVETLVAHLGKFWPRGLQLADAKLLADLEKGEGFVDQCNHRVNFDLTRADDQAKELQVWLDWQRTYDAIGRVTLRSNSLKTAMKEGKKNALMYFERVGEGLDADN